MVEQITVDKISELLKIVEVYMEILDAVGNGNTPEYVFLNGTATFLNKLKAEVDKKTLSRSNIGTFFNSYIEAITGVKRPPRVNHPENVSTYLENMVMSLNFINGCILDTDGVSYGLISATQKALITINTNYDMDYDSFSAFMAVHIVRLFVDYYAAGMQRDSLVVDSDTKDVISPLPEMAVVKVYRPNGICAERFAYFTEDFQESLMHFPMSTRTVMSWLLRITYTEMISKYNIESILQSSTIGQYRDWMHTYNGWKYSSKVPMSIRGSTLYVETEEMKARKIRHSEKSNEGKKPKKPEKLDFMKLKELALKTYNVKKSTDPMVMENVMKAENVDALDINDPAKASAEVKETGPIPQEVEVTKDPQEVIEI